ncbi:hypothetical protein BDV37DRAFT_236888 [Aspergillus pseudonomiae]|uniref:Uncharacterized protein n=1 Tax=Aspergillus pseudonomiae TaxID=1506151 RepID=A0A5N7DS72_9EURO|nr:uncharacterized protein BDV37DRAFT_236888 [Aspergillus pseudonomiae]KAE8409135.1 hypothetical protein BDV37DRAFT_236888 [Aspergillus pseudonomiae]
MHDNWKHLASQGLLSHNTVRRLYRGYFLKDFLLSISILETLATPKVWQGHSMAAV